MINKIYGINGNNGINGINNHWIPGKFFKKQKLKKNIIFVSKKGKAKRFINHK